MSKIPVHSRGSVRSTHIEDDTKGRDRAQTAVKRASVSTPRTFEQGEKQPNSAKEQSKKPPASQFDLAIEKEHSYSKTNNRNATTVQENETDRSFVANGKFTENSPRTSTRVSVLSPSAQNRVTHEKVSKPNDLNKASLDTTDSPTNSSPEHILSSDLKTYQQEKRQAILTPTPSRKGMRLRKSVKMNNADARPKSEIRYNTPQNIAGVKRTGSLPEQSSSRHDTEVKLDRSLRLSLKQPRNSQNTRATGSGSRQGSTTEQSKTRQNTELMQTNPLQDTGTKQNNSGQNTEVKQTKSRQNTDMKTPTSKQTVDLQRRGNDQRETNTTRDGNLRSPSKGRDSDVKQPMSQRTATSPRKHTTEGLVSSRQNSKLKSNSRQNTSKDNNERKAKENSHDKLYATEQDREVVKDNSDDDDNDDWPDVRGITPSKTSFSRHHTRVDSRGDATSRNSGTGEAREQAGPRTRQSPEVAPLVLTSSADPEINETVSIHELNTSEPEGGGGVIQCSYCEMTFKSKLQLDMHKSKLCLGVSQPAELYDLIDGKDFFIVGDGSVIHSTPRGWSVSTKGPLRVSRDGTIEEYYRKLPNFHWDKCYNGRVPEFAVKSGYDYEAACSIYVCRAKVNKELVLGKVVPSRKCAYVACAGHEIKVTEYEILTDPNDLLSWKSTDTVGAIPFGAKKGGHDGRDMVYFIARAEAPDGSLCCGRYVPQDRRCYYPWNGQELSAVNFEFLCKK